MIQDYQTLRMKPENKVVNGLWVGDELSPIELLTLYSFVSHGHDFHLWVYNELKNDLPSGVFLKDANTIISESEIFRKREADPTIGNGKGGITLFADIFRCKLLYELGGWWVDMDILCLNALDFKDEYFFREHPYLPTINNVIKVPKNSELMRLSFEESSSKVDANTEKYLLPNEIFNKHIRSLGLSHYIRDGLCNREWWEDIEFFLYTNKDIPSEWYFIHWINEEWRTQGLDKNSFYIGTRIHSLMNHFQIDFHSLKRDKKFNLWHLKKNSLVQFLKPILKKTPIHSIYKKYIN